MGGNRSDSVNVKPKEILYQRERLEFDQKAYIGRM